MSWDGEVHFPDLTSCVYFLWGYLKSEVCITPPISVTELG